MRIAKRLIFFLLIVGLASTAMVYVQKRRAEAACDFCERRICHGTFYRILTSWSFYKKACCARCGIRWDKENPGRVREAKAMDFAAGEWINAQDALYVEGSDFTHCNPEQVLRVHEESCAVKCFDRCLPSVVAFKKEEDARRFIKDHGGQLLTFERLKEKI